MLRSEQLDFLDSDVAVLEGLVQEGNKLVLDGKYMPDGKKLEIDLTGVESMTNELRMQCVSIVREQFSAREAEQEAESIRNANAARKDNNGRATGAEDGAGSSSDAEADATDGEETMEEFLSYRKGRLESLVKQEEIEYAKVGKRLDKHKRDLALAQELLDTCIKSLQKKSQGTSRKGTRRSVKSGSKRG